MHDCLTEGLATLILEGHMKLFIFKYNTQNFALI